ncbi:MAG: hypothetical protein DRO01_07895, partial [Thermoproteota archaeon]
TRIVENERGAYITTFTNLLGRIDSMEDLGRFLPEFSKFHVGHGRYLIEFFEKRVYRINRLLRDLSTLYAEYYKELNSLPLTEVPDVGSKLSHLEELKRRFNRLEEDVKRLRSEEEKLEEQFQGVKERTEIEALEEKVESLRRKLASKEIQVVSALSSLKKPLKRARLSGDSFNAFMTDTKFALERPDEVRKLIEEGLDNGYFPGKYERKAREALKMLDMVPMLMEQRRELNGAERELTEKKKEIESFESRLRHLRETLARKESELKRIRNEMERLQREIEEAISRMERILGERIELEGDGDVQG